MNEQLVCNVVNITIEVNYYAMQAIVQSLMQQYSVFRVVSVHSHKLSCPWVVSHPDIPSLR